MDWVEDRRIRLVGLGGMILFSDGKETVYINEHYDLMK
jgi:hypothetical protein